MMLAGEGAELLYKPVVSSMEAKDEGERYWIIYPFYTSMLQHLKTTVTLMKPCQTFSEVKQKWVYIIYLIF